MDFVASAVMRKDVMTVPPSMTVAELEATFVQYHVSGFAVVDKHQQLVGVVSHSDVVRAFSAACNLAELEHAGDEDGQNQVANSKLSNLLEDRARTLLVKDVMTANVVTVGPSDSLHDVADLMYERRIHRIFVVEDQKLMGIITPFDFVRLYSTDRIGAEIRPDPTRDF